MTDTITINVRRDETTGDELIDSEAMSLLLGVPADEIRRSSGKLRGEWVKQGRRRAREAMAHTGSGAMLDSLRYWAAKDHNATLVLVEA